jgi:1-acyl-sn-glycerol-3-phosphate acyltransferase
MKHLSFPRHQFLTLFRPFIGIWLRHVTNYRLVDPPPSNATTQYLIISNHVSIYDLTYLLLQLKVMPVIVIHELYQRNPIVAWLLHFFGLIWKQADGHDAKSIRQMKRAAASGRSLLIFPEGDLNWDGNTCKLPISIAKLARYIKLPVLVFREKGAYMAFPRWAPRARRGQVDLSFSQAGDFEPT